MGHRVPDQVLRMLSPATVAMLIIERRLTDWPHQVGPRMTRRGLMRLAVTEERYRRQGAQLEPVVRSAQEARELGELGYA